MLYAFGVGEAAISISGDPAEPERLVHTIRAVGKVSAALTRLKAGDPIGLRGPSAAAGRSRRPSGSDVVIVAGGLGLAPLRPAIYRLLAERDALWPRRPPLRHAQPGRHPLPSASSSDWRRRLDVELEVTVDHAGGDWRGNVGVVDDAHPARRLRSGSHSVALVCGPEIMMRFAVAALNAAGVADERDLPVDGAQHEMRHRPLRPLPVQHGLRLQGRPGVHLRPPAAAPRPAGDLRWPLAASPSSPSGNSPPATAASSSLLDCEDELLAVAGAVEIAYFLEATRAVVKGPYDLSLVEGSITTAHDAERIKEVRRQSQALVTIGACATAGGIQALRNFADVKEFTSIVYARPDYISTLATSTPISAHVPVDFELRGCPINKHQLVEVHQRLSRRPQAGDAGAQRLRRVQAAGATSA